MDTVRTPSPIAEEVDNDDDLSSAYVQTIKRLIERSRQVPESSRLSLSLPSHARRMQRGDFDQHGLEMSFLPESRSIYSINEFTSSTRNNYHLETRSATPQFETSFVTCENELSITDNQPFDFELPTVEEQTNKPPPFARRYFTPYFGQNDQDYGIDHQSGDLSDSSEPDLNTKWSWKNLKREFRLSHSESLFHLYQAKLQHSFFVALLILNIIFNLGAIMSYYLSKFHEMNLCKF